MTAKTLQLVPLEHEARTALPTSEAAAHLGRAQQTLRLWAAYEKYPPGLKPVRVLGRLAWPVAGIRAALGVAQ
jgi:hypothetical protein